MGAVGMMFMNFNNVKQTEFWLIKILHMYSSELQAIRNIKYLSHKLINKSNKLMKHNYYEEKSLSFNASFIINEIVFRGAFRWCFNYPPGI